MVHTSHDIQIVAALNQRYTIGKDGDIPWDIPEDMKRFKEQTYGGPVIMGWKTFQSIGKPLPGRQNIVLTTKSRWGLEEGPAWLDSDSFETGDIALRAESIKEALDYACQAISKHGSLATNISVIGGETVYQSFIPLADKMHLTYVKDRTRGDTYFPCWYNCNWRSDFKGSGEYEGTSYAFFTLHNIENCRNLNDEEPPLVSQMDGDPNLFIDPENDTFGDKANHFIRIIR